MAVTLDPISAETTFWMNCSRKFAGSQTAHPFADDVCLVAAEVPL
jgi:hypothetical protein